MLWKNNKNRESYNIKNFCDDCKKKSGWKKLNKEAKDFYDNQDWILLQDWNYAWVTKNTSEYTDKFRDFFNCEYAYTKYKIKKNKSRNFIFKIAFVFVGILTGVLFWVIFLFKEDFRRLIIQNQRYLWIYFGGLMIFLWSISKWLDINKYQETWSRHSSTLFQLKREMIYYLSGFSPYDTIERKDNFIKKALEIWQGNQNKFSDNLSNKEKKMLDSLILKKK